MVVLRGRVFQVGAAVSVALLGLLAVTLGWAAIQYRQFSADISQSRNRLPASIGRALPAAPPGALDAPEVTLVRYTAGLSTGGAVLFFTDPKRTDVVSGPPAEHAYRQPVTGSPRRADDDRRSSSLDRGAGRPRRAHRPVGRRKPRVRPRRHHDREPGRRAGDRRCSRRLRHTKTGGRRDRINQLEAVSRRSVAGSNLAGCRRRRLSHDAQTIASKLRTSVSAAGRDAVNQGTRATGV